jgi:hypothetical protein
MSFAAKNPFWRSIVRDVTDTKEHPGYMFEFFRSFKEFDEYLSAHHDLNWRETEWGKFLMKPDFPEADCSYFGAMDIENLEATAPADNSYTQKKNSYENVARDLIRAGVTDVDTLHAIISNTTTGFRELEGYTTHTYKPTKAALGRYISKYNTKTQRALRKTPKHIVLALIKHYVEQRLSLRDISYKLNKNDGIQLSYERIRELLNDASEG